MMPNIHPKEIKTVCRREGTDKTVAIDYNQNIGGVDLKTTATLVLAGERE
jgi:hypothetical protein